MAGETTIKWTNDKDYCKVVFVVEDKIYLLFRKQFWGQDIMYSIPRNKEVSINVGLGRELWTMLTKLHNFKLMELDHE